MKKFDCYCNQFQLQRNVNFAVSETEFFEGIVAPDYDATRRSNMQCGLPIETTAGAYSAELDFGYCSNSIIIESFKIFFNIKIYTI